MMAHHDDVDGTEERKHSCWQQVLVIHDIIIAVVPISITSIDGTTPISRYVLGAIKS